jgi:ornithine cyclodeaminase
MATPVLDAAATAALLPYVPLSEEIAAVLAEKAQGKIISPTRSSLPLPDGGVLLLMPASDSRLAVVKLITVTPANADRGLPLIRGEVAVMRASDGERLCILDGPEVTARRTAAASLLAARLLAPEPEGELLIVGAGVQALSHAMAFAAGLGVARVLIAARDRAKAGALAARLRDAGIEAFSAGSPDEAARQAPLIVTATGSPEPVISENVRDDAFIAAIGSFSPANAEVPAALVRRCRLVTDDLEAARHEAGDLIRAGADWSAVTPLERLLAKDLDLRPASSGAGREQEAAGRRGQAPLAHLGPVLYKAVGCAALDLAAARLAFQERS